MTEKYTDELAKWVEKRKSSSRRDKNTVAFLAVRDDVLSALEAGYSVKTVWEHMHENGRIKYAYETFLKHVKRFKEKKTDQVQITKPVSLKEKTTRGQKIKTTKTSVAPKTKGFTFDSKPNKEDLL
ncbi:MAG: TraK family protein [gamma proteobacterium symbiont of Lucinoma myriamae]|nr:TraK family protein [gamma proteobacterium symbiont of Lucinoma myriamae]MCU7833458.1 TraK family protein [gamma proteobacterium symbiont of Lucinoma myriamae]